MRDFVRQAATLTASALAAALGSSTGAQAHEFKIIGNADQARQIEQSLSACPSLGSKLDALPASVGFQQIRVTTPDETKRVGPFLAAVKGNEMILADGWLGQQSQPYSDVRRLGEILPDNLCFDLGHLSDHVAHPSPPPIGVDMHTWMDQRLKAESLAFIRGWSFVVEAAKAMNGGRPLNGAQVGGLLINLRYRFAFLQAMLPQAVPKLSILSDGTIPETNTNVAAIQSALSHSSIADLQ